MNFVKFKWDPKVAVRALLGVLIGLALLPLSAAKAFYLRYCVAYLTPREVHVDGPLSDFAVEAFDVGNLIAGRVMPTVSVGKQSDGYYIVDPATWLRLPNDDLRAPKTEPSKVEFTVSTDTYTCKNRALRGEISDEERANADNQIMLERRTVGYVASQLLRMKERRVATKVTSITNIGSGVILAGATKWSNYNGSSPLSDVTTGHAFMRSRTGLRPNVAIVDWDTAQILRRHPELLDYYKYTAGGQITMEQLRDAFSVREIVIADAVYNTAVEGATQSMGNIWGNVCLLMHEGPINGLKVQRFGVSMRWTDPALGRAMAVERTRAANNKKVDLFDVGYYDDEKTVARDLCYGITATI